MRKSKPAEVRIAFALKQAEPAFPAAGTRMENEVLKQAALLFVAEPDQFPLFNAFDCSCFTGFTEKINNKIKALERIAFGYRVFRDFRTQILCANNV